MKKPEPLEIMVARIDERVHAIHLELPNISKKVSRHDRELLIGKVLLLVALAALSYKFPSIAEAIGSVMK